MATIVFSAIGAAVGGSIGGTVLGASMVAVGRFAGAMIGNAIDQRILGSGSDPVETGRLDRIRMTQSGEGHPIAQIHGRARVGGHVIWASQFEEHVTSSGGGKGTPAGPEVKQFSYSVSLAVAVCEGPITHISRIWADGTEIVLADISYRVHGGGRNQEPDPKIEAIEGVGNAPAYRDISYIVFEDLSLEPFGNRIPQFSFEVTRPDSYPFDRIQEPARAVTAVALLSGSGEYALAKTPVTLETAEGEQQSMNMNSPSGWSNIETSLEQLDAEVPNCKSTSLVVSWFGDDLRCDQCQIKPKVEQKDLDAKAMPWRAGGIDRASAEKVSQQGGRPVYGGTPADASVIEAIECLKETQKHVLYYPFILMDQIEGNGRLDPWSGAEDQPGLPWRGRITLSRAPEREGSPDGTALATSQVTAFFGSAQASDFTIYDGRVTYSGPEEWGYRRFILHNAALAAAAGGVDAFCIGSEMRSLTQIRGAENSFPAVAELKSLAAEVRQILGPDCKISYAADWTEYFGYQPSDGSGDRFFHLDPLWADDNIDFVGIDNYMPLSDWRDGEDHPDAEWGSVYNLDYLKSNIEGGEGYDWYYADADARLLGERSPISDGAYNEPWVWRYKDVRAWWSNPHHERINGVRKPNSTEWIPQSKPIWFTEIGCGAVDKGANQPNKFIDPKSSESSLPYFSNGQRDDLMQAQYLRALYHYWGDEEKNPVSAVYNGPMIDTAHMYVWAWDLRPFPNFPINLDLWSDGENFSRRHWINGRVSGRCLASVVYEICSSSGLRNVDVSGLYGYVRGYHIPRPTTARAALQPLMMAFGFDAVLRQGKLTFVMRKSAPVHELSQDEIVWHEKDQKDIALQRDAEVELSGRVRINFPRAESDFQISHQEAVLPDNAAHGVSETDLQLVLTRPEAQNIAETWLAQATLSRESAQFALPLSQRHIAVGDRVRLTLQNGQVHEFRLDQMEYGPTQEVEAVRSDASIYRATDFEQDIEAAQSYVPPMPMTPILLDLPLIKGNENPAAPYLAVSARPWPGGAAVFSSDSEEDYTLETMRYASDTVGVTLNDLAPSRIGVWDTAQGLDVKISNGTLESVSEARVFNGHNLIAIGNGSVGNWEVLQFKTAELIAPRTYRLTGLLRGQLGTGPFIADPWPEGARVVLVKSSSLVENIGTAQIGQTRHFRVGPSRKSYSDPSYTALEYAVTGVGLRPLAPVHLRFDSVQEGVIVSWIRQTRVGGDRWDLEEVPLGEDTELYRVEAVVDGQILWSQNVDHAQFTYTDAKFLADGSPQNITFRVAQISAEFGAGLSASKTLRFP